MERIYVVEYLDNDGHWKPIPFTDKLFFCRYDRDEAEAVAKDYAEVSRLTTGDIRERIAAHKVAKGYRVVRYDFAEEVFGKIVE